MYVDHKSLNLDKILKTNTNKDNFENTHDIVTVMSDDADDVTYANTLNTVVLDFDLVGWSGDVVVSPLDDDDILSPVSDDVPALIVILALVLQLDFIARSFGSVDADV